MAALGKGSRTSGDGGRGGSRILVRIARGKVGVDGWFEQAVGRWVIACRLIVPADMNPRIAELRVFPGVPAKGREAGTWTESADDVPPGGVTTAVLRRISLTAPVRRLNEVLGSSPDLLTAGLSRIRPRERPRDGDAPRRGRKPHASELLAQVAAEYVRAFQTTKAPILEIARRRRESTAKVRAWVHQARVRGFLLGRGRGRGGGALSPMAMEVLTERKRVTTEGKRKRTATHRRRR